METLCDSKEEMEAIAREFLAVTRNCFFIGRSLDFYVGLRRCTEAKRNLLHSSRGLCWWRIKAWYDCFN